MSITSFCLTVKKVIAWFDDSFFFSFLAFFYQARDRINLKNFMARVLKFTKRWVGAYWKLYLYGWVSLDFSKASDEV